MSDLERRLIEMSKLIQNVTDVVARSLREVEVERGDRVLELQREMVSRKRLLYSIAGFTFVNIVFGIYTIHEIHSMVNEIRKVQISQFEHRVSSGLTDAQVQALIGAMERNSPTPQMKEDLKVVGAMKPDDKTIQRAAQAAVIEGVPPKEVAKDLLPPIRPDAGTSDAGVRDAKRRR